MTVLLPDEWEGHRDMWAGYYTNALKTSASFTATLKVLGDIGRHQTQTQRSVAPAPETGVKSFLIKGWWRIREQSLFIHRRSFTFQIKIYRVATTPSLSLSISCLLFIQILQTGCFFQFSTFTSFVREWHYASVIMQFITNNRFVYGGPISCSLSAPQFQNNNNNT